MITESKFTIDEEIPTLLVKETDKNFNNVKLKIREESSNFYPEGIENSVFDLAESNSENETKNSIANNNLEKPVDSSNELTIINNASKEELDLESESNNNDNNNQNEELKKDSTQTNLS
jgi:hypothetical protein